MGLLNAKYDFQPVRGFFAAYARKNFTSAWEELLTYSENSTIPTPELPSKITAEITTTPHVAPAIVPQLPDFRTKDYCENLRAQLRQTQLHLENMVTTTLDEISKRIPRIGLKREHRVQSTT